MLEIFVRNCIRKFSVPLSELQLAEQMNVRKEETPAYTFSALLADTGGALGLILGLSILQIFHWIWAMIPFAKNVKKNIKMKLLNAKVVTIFF